MRDTPIFNFYFRHNTYHDNSVVRLMVFSDGHWLSSDELESSYSYDFETLVGPQLRVTGKILKSHGVTDEKIRLILRSKQCHLEGVALPIGDLSALGWDILSYPRKYIEVKDKVALLEEVSVKGLSIDVSNLLGDEFARDTQGRVVKGVVDILDEHKVKLFLYTDHKLWGWLKKMGWYDTYDYLMDFFSVKKPKRRIVTAGRYTSADKIMLDWADRLGNHILSRDEFAEWDPIYDWVLHGAENGCPRLHKFECLGGQISIRDLGLIAEIPDHY